MGQEQKVQAPETSTRGALQQSQPVFAPKAITQLSALPSVFDCEADQALPNRVYGAWTPMGGVRHLRRALLIHERQTMQRRVQDLQRACAPFSNSERDEVAAAVSGMLAGFRSMRQTGSDAVATIGSVMSALEGLPPWAIIQGCGLIRTGRAGLKVEYAPNDAEVATVVRRLVDPYARRLAAAEALLCAPIDGDERVPPRAKPDPIDPLAAQVGHDPRRTGA